MDQRMAEMLWRELVLLHFEVSALRHDEPQLVFDRLKGFSRRTSGAFELTEAEAFEKLQALLRSEYQSDESDPEDAG